MSTLPTDRTIANTAAEHVADHNVLHGVLNTQRLWVPPAAMSILAGTPAITVFGSKYAGWAFDQTSVESVMALVEFPQNWVTYTAKLKVVSGSTGVARWDVQAITLAAADNVTTPTYASITGAPQDESLTGNILADVDVSGSVSAASPLHAFKIERTANHANDNLAADAYLLGIEFTKAS